MGQRVLDSVLLESRLEFFTVPVRQRTPSPAVVILGKYLDAVGIDIGCRLDGLPVTARDRHVGSEYGQGQPLLVSGFSFVPHAAPLAPAGRELVGHSNKNHDGRSMITRSSLFRQSVPGALIEGPNR